MFSIVLSDVGRVLQSARQLIGEEALAVSDQWIGSSPSRPRDSRQEILQVRPVERRPPAVEDSCSAGRAATGRARRQDDQDRVDARFNGGR